MELPTIEQLVPYLTDRGKIEVDLALARMQVNGQAEEIRMLRQALEQQTEGEG